MINQAIGSKLIKIYFYVCEKYESELQYHCQRFSNNDKPAFTDQEAMTIYLFAVNQEQKFSVRGMYNFAKDYLPSWFPTLPSYVAFVSRLNRLSGAFKALSELLIAEFRPTGLDSGVSLLDSMPIVTCSGKRQGRVAREITDKGYCSTKGMYYYGVKLHELAFRRQQGIPYPESIVFSRASENDLNVYKENWAGISNRFLYGDRIYIDKAFFEQTKNQLNATMLTPTKLVKGETERIRQFDRAHNDLFSKAVSAIRQPIESAFNWLIEKTGIQRASKVRSTKGLLLHLYGKLASAFLNPILKP